MPFISKKYLIKTETKAFLFLIKELKYSQKEAQRFISKGRLLKNAIPIIKASEIIIGEVEFIVFNPITRNLQVNTIEEDFVVFDKPSGVLVHPQNTLTPYSLIDELKYQFGISANIVHRIDQETSGLVLCSKNKTSEIKLKMLFENRKIEKEYLALVHGNFKKDISVNEPLLRKENHSAIIRMVVKVDKLGKKSRTDFEPIKYFPNLNMSLVLCKPFTGRQHQIRVHLFHVKHSIVGDPIYGQTPEDILKFLDKKLSKKERKHKSGADRLLLHSNSLKFKFKEKIFKVESKVDALEVFLKHTINTNYD